MRNVSWTPSKVRKDEKRERGQAEWNGQSLVLGPIDYKFQNVIQNDGKAPQVKKHNLEKEKYRKKKEEINLEAGIYSLSENGYRTQQSLRVKSRPELGRRVVEMGIDNSPYSACWSCK